jgi:hypothetical protein
MTGKEVGQPNWHALVKRLEMGELSGVSLD